MRGCPLKTVNIITHCQLLRQPDTGSKKDSGLLSKSFMKEIAVVARNPGVIPDSVP